MKVFRDLSEDHSNHDKDTDKPKRKFCQCLPRLKVADKPIGWLILIHQDTPDNYHVVENVQTAQGGRNMGLDPASHRIYVVSAKFGPVPTESTATNPRRRAPILPGTFMVMVVEPVGSH